MKFLRSPTASPLTAHFSREKRQQVAGRAPPDGMWPDKTPHLPFPEKAEVNLPPMTGFPSLIVGAWVADEDEIVLIRAHEANSRLTYWRVNQGRDEDLTIVTDSRRAEPDLRFDTTRGGEYAHAKSAMENDPYHQGA